MTKITYSIKGPVFSLKAEGHAGGAPRGQNIICAGVSAITMALLNILLNDDAEDRAEVDTRYSINEEKGILAIRSRPALAAKFDRVKVKAYFKMAVIGLQALAQEYPEEITVEEEKSNGGD